MTCLKWQTSVSIESTVSTSIRSSHSPRGHSLRLVGSPSAAWKAVSLKDDHASVNLANQPLEGVIRDIGRGTRPAHDPPPLIEQETQFPPDDPAMIGEAFPADLLGAAAFAHGMDQLDAIGVNDPEHGRCRQEGLRPVVMSR